MNGERLAKERLSRKWEQQEAAARLKVSQPYLSLIEAGKRPVTEKLARRAVRVFNLPPTALPAEFRPPKTSGSKNLNRLALQLAALGYPKFSHLKRARKSHPASVLIALLFEDDLDGRIVEALPWLVFNFPDLEWTEVVRAAKTWDAQNRLGFLLSLAYDLARKSKDKNKIALFKQLALSLEKSLLARDDSFQRTSLTESEKKWLKKNRSRNARRWRVLSNLSAEHLIY